MQYSLRQVFFGFREICRLGVRWTIFAFDDVSGCFHRVNSTIAVSTLANNLKHRYFVSWLYTDGYFAGHLLKFRPGSGQAPVMFQRSWCANLYVKKFHHVKSDFSWHSCTCTTASRWRFGRRHSFSYDDLLSSFFRGMIVYHFLQEDKLWKNSYTLICIFVA